MKLPLLLLLACFSLSADPASEASALLKDQKRDAAFRSFLKGLEVKPVGGVAVKGSYDEALAIYLDPEKAAGESAGEILEKFKESEGVEYLLAVSYANKGDFARFFELFWKGFQREPEHFLAYKAQSVLHIKLMEAAPTPEKREEERRQVARLAMRALELEPRDHSLYRMAIAFSDDPGLLKSCLNKILDNHIVTPRGDINFYVQKAILAKEYDLAERYLNAASEWYPYSRAINSAKDALDQEKRG